MFTGSNIAIATSLPRLVNTVCRLVSNMTYFPKTFNQLEFELKEPSVYQYHLHFTTSSEFVHFLTQLKDACISKEFSR